MYTVQQLSNSTRELTSSTSEGGQGEQAPQSDDRAPALVPTYEGQPPSLTGTDDSQDGPDQQVHPDAFAGGGDGVPTQPIIWWWSQGREGYSQGPNDEEERDPGPVQTTGGEELSGQGETPGGHSRQENTDEEDINRIEVSPKFTVSNNFDTGVEHVCAATPTRHNERPLFLCLSR